MPKKRKSKPRGAMKLRRRGTCRHCHVHVIATDTPNLFSDYNGFSRCNNGKAHKI